MCAPVSWGNCPCFRSPEGGKKVSLFDEKREKKRRLKGRKSGATVPAKGGKNLCFLNPRPGHPVPIFPIPCQGPLIGPQEKIETTRFRASNLGIKKGKSRFPGDKPSRRRKRHLSCRKWKERREKRNHFRGEGSCPSPLIGEEGTGPPGRRAVTLF